MLPRRRDPSPPNLCIHFITFGLTHGQPHIPMPVIIHLDLSALQAPPRHLLQRYTGISPEISDSFFSIPAHERQYQNSLRLLEAKLQDRLAHPRPRPGVCVAVLVNCTAGMHRSVATAERMAREVEAWRWDGVVLVIEHLDTDVERGVRRAQRAGAGPHSRRMYEDYHAGNLGGIYR